MQNSIPTPQAITANERTFLLGHPSSNLNYSSVKPLAPWPDAKRGLPLRHKGSPEIIWSNDLVPLNLLPTLFEDPKKVFSGVENFQDIIKCSIEILDSFICGYPQYKWQADGAEPKELDGAELALDTETLEYLLSHGDESYHQEILKQLKDYRNKQQFWRKSHEREMLVNATIVATVHLASSHVDFLYTPLAARIGMSLFAMFVYTKCLNSRLSLESNHFNFAAFLVIFGMDKLFNVVDLPQPIPNTGLIPLPALLVSAIHSTFLLSLYNSTIILLEDSERMLLIEKETKAANTMITQLEGKPSDTKNSTLTSVIKSIDSMLPNTALHQKSLLPFHNNTQGVVRIKELQQGNVEENQALQPRLS